MKEYIEIHTRERASSEGLPNMMEANKLAAQAVGECAFIFYEPSTNPKYPIGYFGVVWHEKWCQFTYPLLTWWDDGTITFVDSNNKAVALVLPHGTVCDLSEGPPFLPMSPCPWCHCIVKDKNQPWNAHAFARCSGVTSTYKEIFLTNLPIKE